MVLKHFVKKKAKAKLQIQEESKAEAPKAKAPKKAAAKNLRRKPNNQFILNSLLIFGETIFFIFFKN